MHLHLGYIGHDTNNEMELWGTIHDIQIVVRENYRMLVVEGDSQIIMHLFSKTLRGQDPKKFIPSWHLSSGLVTLHNAIQYTHTYIPPMSKGKQIKLLIN